MTCREVAELLIDFVGGELPQEAKEHIRQHLCACPPCVTYMETYQLTIRMTRQLPDVPLPLELERKLKQILKEQRDSSGSGDEKTC